MTWQARGLCSDLADDTMFPDTADELGVRRAKDICASCSVRTECLAAALSNGEKYGIWGGLTAEERAGLRNRVLRRGA